MLLSTTVKVSGVVWTWERSNISFFSAWSVYVFQTMLEFCFFAQCLQCVQREVLWVTAGCRGSQANQFAHTSEISTLRINLCFRQEDWLIQLLLRGEPVKYKKRKKTIHENIVIWTAGSSTEACSGADHPNIAHGHQLHSMPITIWIFKSREQWWWMVVGVRLLRGSI